MSFLGARGIKLFNKIKEKNLFFNNLFSSVFAIIYIVPYIAIMNNQISLWSAFFSVFFTPIFSIIYFLSLFFSWWNVFDILFKFIYQFIFTTSQILNSANLFINMGFFNSALVVGFYYSMIEILNLFLTNQRRLKKWYLKDLEKKY